MFLNFLTHVGFSNIKLSNVGYPTFKIGGQCSTKIMDEFELRQSSETLRSGFSFGRLSTIHYGLKLSVPKILNFPLESPSQIAPKFSSLVEQCRTKIIIQHEAGYGWEGFHVKICLQKSVETE